MGTENNSIRKIIVIGLDGVPLSLASYLMDSDIMPNLKGLFQRGTHGKLRSVIPPITPAAWTSFQTGKYPNKHGIIDFYIKKPFTYDYQFVNSTRITGETLWKVLSKANKEPIIINVPMTYPPENINGIIIPGFDAPETTGESIHPKGLMKFIEERTGKYNFYKMWWNETVLKRSGIKGLVNELLQITDSQIKGVKLLMKEFNWNFFMYHFQVTDALQHHVWRLIATDTSLLSNTEKEYHDLILKFYAEIDSKIGELLNLIDNETYVCILSDHGFVSMNKAFFLNSWLNHKGYLSENNYYPLVKLLDNVIHMSKKMGIPVLKNIRYLLKKNPARTLRKINFQKTQAYAYCYHSNFALICLNKKKAIDVELLKKDLKEISHNGEFIVKDVYPWYGGETADAMIPDLVVEFVEGYSIMQKLHSKTRPLAIDLSGDGNHAIDGIFCLAGNNIKKSHEVNAEIVDIFPTILHLLDIPIPDDIDGKVISNAFKNYEESHYIAPDTTATSFISTGDEDFEKVADRLMDLGYL
jgi:predicted AlkP superfamily phosphohydrolase/phosphomutase